MTLSMAIEDTTATLIYPQLNGTSDSVNSFRSTPYSYDVTAEVENITVSILQILTEVPHSQISYPFLDSAPNEFQDLIELELDEELDFTFDQIEETETL